MSRVNLSASSLRALRHRRTSRLLLAFTLVEILISILILALGVLGLGVLFPVIIREQRLGTDATTGVLVSNMARSVLTQTNWGAGLQAFNGQPSPYVNGTFPPTGGLGAARPRRDASATAWLWSMLRNSSRYSLNLPFTARGGLGQGWSSSSPGTFQPYGQGEWFTALVDPATGTAKIGYPNIQGSPYPNVDMWGTQVPACVDLPVSQRLYPLTDNTQPQFVWDFAVQRVTQFNAPITGSTPDGDDLRAVLFVRRIDPRIRATNGAQTLTDVLTAPSGSAEFRFPVGESPTEAPTLDGTGVYSGIKTCAIEFWYNPATPAQNHRDRLYVAAGPAPTNFNQYWAEMKQPGQKLVDNLGNIYTVVGSGNETGAGGDYVQVDPPVPDDVTVNRSRPAVIQTTYTVNQPVKRAIWQVAFTPQIPVSVTLVPIAKGTNP